MVAEAILTTRPSDPADAERRLPPPLVALPPNRPQRSPTRSHSPAWSAQPVEAPARPLERPACWSPFEDLMKSGDAVKERSTHDMSMAAATPSP